MAGNECILYIFRLMGKTIEEGNEDVQSNQADRQGFGDDPRLGC